MTGAVAEIPKKRAGRIKVKNYLRGSWSKLTHICRNNILTVFVYLLYLLEGKIKVRHSSLDRQHLYILTSFNAQSVV